MHSGPSWKLYYDLNGRIKQINNLPIQLEIGGFSKRFGDLDYKTYNNGWVKQRGFFFKFFLFNNFLKEFLILNTIYWVN